MVVRKTTFRYLYWIITGFLRKNLYLIFLSFIISLVGIIAFVSFFPYIVQAVTTEKQVIGIAGTFDYNNVPTLITDKISNSLLYINEKGEIVPILADSWEEVKNGKEYRFHLKKNLLWSDGKDFTAKDLNYEFKGVKVIKEDDYIIVFKLEKPLPIFPNLLTQPAVKYPLKGVAGLYDVNKVQTKFGNITELELSPNKDGYPIYSYKFFDTETKLIEAYKLGEIEQMQTNNKKIVDLFSSWNNTVVDRSIDYSQLVTLFFNMNEPFLQEKDVRQAIAMGISTEKYNNLGDQAAGPIPPTSWAFFPDIKRIQYNPDLARKILGKYEAGDESAEAKEQKKLTISTFYEYLPLAEEIQKSLKDIGIETTVETFSFQDNSYDLLLAPWMVPHDPDQYIFWHSTQTADKGGKNLTNLKNVKIDKLLEDGRSTLSVKDRTDIYIQFQKVMMDEVPAHFMYYPYAYMIKRK